MDEGICKLVSGRRKKAIELFDQSLSYSENAVAYNFKATAFKLQGDNMQEAIDNYSLTIKMDSLNWLAYNSRGEEYLKKGDVKSALADFSSVIKLRPKNKTGYKNRGIIRMQNRQYVKAYRDFSFGVSLDTTDYDLYFNRAICSISVKQYENAHNDLNFILRHKPRGYEAYYAKYKIEMLKNDSLSAIVYLDSASKFKRISNNYNLEFLALAKSLSDHQSIIKAYGRMIRFNPYNQKYLFERAMVYYSNKEYSSAIGDFNKFLRRKEQPGKALYYLGVSLKNLGKTELGGKYIKQAVENGFRPK